MRKKKISEEEVQAVANAIVQEADEQNKNVEEIVEEIIKESEYYVIRSGETLEDVAKKFETTVEELEELNNHALMMAGNQIKVK